jgi:hypothetical protein
MEAVELTGDPRYLREQGRDDAVIMDDVGQAYLWTNARSCEKGLEGTA